MSKFLLNLIVQISKALLYSKIQFLFEKEFSSDFGASGPGPPALARYARRPPNPCSAYSAQAALAYLRKGVFPSTLRTPAGTPSPSHITAMWGPPVSSIPFPTPVDRCHFSSSPPATPHRPASNLEMPSEVFTPLNPSSSRPTINGVKAITAGRFPLPRPGHYKRPRSTPRPSPHSRRPHLLAPEFATSTPPSASSADCSPPSPGRVRPSAAPSCSW
jgi:hypothetical protein